MVNYERVIDYTFQTLFSHSPYPFQKQVVSHVLSMGNQLPITPVLIVESTGKGKSSLYQSLGVIQGGVTLVIENKLALSSDQQSKIENLESMKGIVHSFQLDSIKHKDHRDALVAKLSNLEHNTDKAVFLFCSPEALLKPHWRQLCKNIIANKTLNLVCIDEVHLFVSFGLSIRHSFINLRKCFFDLLHEGNAYKVPLIFMTATFSDQYLQLLQKMTGVTVSHPSKFWRGTSSFIKREIKISVNFSTQGLKSMKTQMARHLGNNLTKKCIVYTNSAKSTVRISETFDTWLDTTEAVKGDTLVINGPMESEWKYISSRYFTKTVSEEEVLLKINSNQYHPRILFATAGCIGAGLDSDQVHLVLRDGMPPDLMSFIQEMGRCGRNRDVNSKEDEFSLNVTFDGFIYLYRRIFEKKIPKESVKQLQETVIKQDDMEKMQLYELLECMKMMVTDIGCWHIFIEMKCSASISPSSTTSNTDCRDSCPHCLGQTKKYILPVIKAGVVNFINDTFYTNQTIGGITPQGLCKKLSHFTNVGVRVYNRKTSKAPMMKYISVTIMQLITCGIITLKVEKIITGRKVEAKLFCILNTTLIMQGGEQISTPTYLVESYWAGIPMVTPQIVIA